MKHLARLAPLLVFPFTVGFGAPEPKAPAPAAAAPVEVTLRGDYFDKRLGVEPLGGRFQTLLPERAKRGEAGVTTLSTVSRVQDRSTLAIFASSMDTVHEEKPLARVEVSGLKAGGQKDRVKVSMALVGPGRVSIEAWDSATGRPLAVRQVKDEELRQAKYAPSQIGLVTTTKVRPPAAALVTAGQKPEPIAERKGQKPAPIASLDTKPTGGLWQTIGVRGAGGMITPFLPAGSPVNTTKAYYLRPRYPDQTTADLSLFYGDSPYIENNKLWQRYLISAIPTGSAKRQVKLEFTVLPNGKLSKPKATEVVSGQEVRIDEYSAGRAQALSEAPRENAAPNVRQIPAAPRGA